MIIVYTGTPGSGKSYHATRQVHNCTKHGVYVIANFGVNLPKQDMQERFFYCPTSKLTVDYLLDFQKQHHKPRKESQTVVLIDECSLIFNSRDYSRADRMKWINFFAQHRHLGFDFILITQQDRMIDRQIRGFIELEYVHRKLTNFGLKGWIMRFILHKQFICVHKWYSIKERIDCEFFSIKKKIASSYDTFSMFQD